MCNASPYLFRVRLLILWALFCTKLCLLECFLILLSLTAAVAVLLTVILIIIIGVLAVGGFFNYRRTGSLLPALPKLPRYVLKAFRVGMSVNWKCIFVSKYFWKNRFFCCVPILVEYGKCNVAATLVNFSLLAILQLIIIV